jgi:hypothetical protein
LRDDGRGPQSMADQSVNLDYLSLEDFHRTLAARLSEVDAAMRKLADVGGKAPALGTFHDAAAGASQYRTLHHEYEQRLSRLRSAVVAAQTATATIIDNYRRTEDRNHANAADIAARLGGVAAALGEDSSVV